MHIPALDLEQILPFEPILAAVSGGADSMAMAAALREQGARIMVASFDHQIRPDSADDIAFVSDYCEKHGLRFVSGKGDVPAYAAKMKLSLEEAARHLRYSFLFQTAADLGCKAIAVGHTMDDQAETVLMHFMRGAGIAGLKGMLPVSKLARYSDSVVVLRPILGWRRSDTEACCAAHGIQPRFDTTNQDPAYPRNKIRAELLPILREYNPAITETLARNARVLAGQYELYSETVENEYSSAILRSGNDWISFSTDRLASMPLILRNEVVRKAVFTLQPGIRDLDAETFDRFSLVKDTDLGGGFRSVLEVDELFISDRLASLPTDRHPQVKSPTKLEPGVTTLEDGWELELTYLNPPFPTDHENNPTEVWIDISDQPTSIAIRPFQHGDRFTPFGFTSGNVKCSDLFINSKLPARYRQAYPILLVDQAIAWLPLIRRSNVLPIQKNTRLAARIRIQKN